jgi:hypothetical protein
VSQDDSEVVFGPQGIQVVVAKYTPAAGEGVLVQLLRRLVVTKLAHYDHQIACHA